MQRTAQSNKESSAPFALMPLHVLRRHLENQQLSLLMAAFLLT